MKEHIDKLIITSILLKRHKKHTEASHLIEVSRVLKELKAHSDRVEREWKQKYYTSIRLICEELDIPISQVDVQVVLNGIRELKKRPISLSFDTERQIGETEEVEDFKEGKEEEIKHKKEKRKRS